MDINTRNGLRVFLTIGGVFLMQTVIFGMLLNACGIDRQTSNNICNKNVSSEEKVYIHKPQKRSKWLGYTYGGMASGVLIAACCLAATRDIFSRR